MLTVLRAVGATLILTLVVGVGAVAAADPSAPPTVGGTIIAGHNLVRIKSLGNVPATVTLTAQVVTLAETSFDIEPGETHDIALSGDIRGDVSALFTTKPSGVSLDVGTAELVVTLRPYTPPFDWTPVIGIGLGIILLLAFVLFVIRYKPWRWRLITNPEVSP